LSPDVCRSSAFPIDLKLSEQADAARPSYQHSSLTPSTTMRTRRWRLTIAGIMGIVAFTAFLLGCIAEIYRIRRTQTFYLTEAARYAALENHEDNMRALNLNSALLTKNLMELEEQFNRAASDRDQFVFPHVNNRPVASKRKRYYEHLESGRKALVRADVAKINAQRFSELKHRYEVAGKCFWLPFAPDPLKLVK
jgi:hypothetical protein